MPDIKTREMVKGTIKAVDKSAVFAERMRQNAAQISEKTSDGGSSSDNSAEYGAAVELTESFGESERALVTAAETGVKYTSSAVKQGKKLLIRQKDNDASQRTSRTTPENASAKEAVPETGRTIKTREYVSKTGGAAKAARTEENTVSATKKASEKAEKRARKAAARLANAPAKQTSKATGKAAKKASKKAAKSAKAVGGLKGILLSIVISVLPLLCVVTVALICGISVSFGNMISTSDDDESKTNLQAALESLSEDYRNRLDEIIDAAHCDEVMTAGDVDWKGAAIILAAKNSADESDPEDGFSRTTQKVTDDLADVFWAMHAIESAVETKTEYDDQYPEGEERAVTVLHITVTAKTKDEMADLYGFTDGQRELMNEYSGAEYDDFWHEMSGGFI